MNDQPPPLAGITVVDLTRVLAGPYCTQMLSDLGARVIKVEDPDGGDDARALGPHVDGFSAYFASVNRGKQSIALDLKQPADRALFDEILAGADVLVENFRPGVMARLGYDWERVSARHPSLVMASISGFGQTGPYRSLPAYDMVVQAMSGMMSINGAEGGAPTRVGTSIGDLAAGLFAVIGIQAALLERARTGRGRQVDIGMLDCQVALLENAVARYGATGVVPGPIGSRHPAITPFDVFATADGHLVIAAGRDSMFVKLCELLGMPEAAADPRFRDVPSRSAHHAELKRLIEQGLAAHGAAHWRAAMTEKGIPNGPVNTIADVVGDPQVAARGMLVEVALPGGRAIPAAGSPIRFDAQPAQSVQSAPALDEHREVILAALRGGTEGR
jgi:CoA:oxalate CoA-transferase